MTRTGARILVAEDNPANLRMFTEFLTSIGYVTVRAKDGLEALEIMSRQDFDLVFMDVQMPRLDGLETVRRLRAGACGQASSRTPVVALTARTSRGDQERCLQAGMTGYLPKPVSLDDLEKTAALHVAQEVLEGAREVRAALAPLMKEFTAFIRERVAAAEAHVAAGELEQVARAGHDVKGACMVFGKKKLNSLGDRLEEAASIGDAGEAARIVGELYVVLAELEAGVSGTSGLR